MASRKVIAFDRNWINEVTPGVPFTLAPRGVVHSATKLNQLEELLTLHEAAVYLKTSDRTIYNLIYEKKLRAVRAGRQYRIPVSALIEYMRG